MSARKLQRGQALVEFALVLPIIILMFFAVVYFAMAFNLQMVLNGAAREGAKAWANNPGRANPCCLSCTSPCDPDGSSTSDNGFNKTVLPVIRKYIEDNGYDPNTSETGTLTTEIHIIADDCGSSATLNSLCTTAASYEDASKVKLTLTYDYGIPIPFFNDIGKIELRASAIFKKGS